MTEKRIPSPCDSRNPLHKIAAELAQSSPSDKKHEAKTAKQQFDEHTAGEDMTPLERLRFFCSLAFKEGQDWLDVEPFFDDIEKQLAQSATARLKAEQVEWVVNDIAELGVKIGNQFFWLYKGHSLVYGDYEDTSKDGVCLHDDGTPMHWRPVGKREFGECCHPVNYEDLRSCGRPHYIGTVRLDDSDEWQPLPSPRYVNGELPK